MQVSRAQVVILLRQQGQRARADQANQQLPDTVDTHAHGELLNNLGIDPRRLIRALLGGGNLHHLNT